MRSGTDGLTMWRVGLGALFLMGAWSVVSTGATFPSSGVSGMIAPTGGGSGVAADETTGFEELGMLRWRFTGPGPVRGTPTLAGGLVLFGTAAGEVHAVGAGTGEEAWRHDAGAPVVSSPAVAGGRLFVSSRSALEALDVADGSPVWRHDFGDELPLPWGYEGWDYRTSSPAVHAGTVYVGAGDGHVYALDAADGSLVWSFAAGARIRSTPTVDAGTVYVGDSDGILRALDAASGAERWRFETDGHALDAADFGFDRRQIYSAAAVADGAVYFGSRDANLYALDAASGQLRWKSNDGTSAWVIGSPVIRGDTVYETRSSSGRARALDVADGSERWSVRTGGPIFAAPVLQGDVVLVVNELGLLLALEAASGAERWRYGLGASVWAPPRIEAGRLYVGDDAGALHSFDRRRGPTPRLAVYWDADLADRAALGGSPGHEAVAHWFARRGYEPLDADDLTGFLRRGAAGGPVSVVVFAMDAVPAATIGPSSERALLRDYLESGGKAVWLGRPPGLVRFDDEGRPVGIDRERPSRLLGVDLGINTGDRYMVRPTVEGLEWGLRDWWTAGPQVRRTPGVTPLGVDEIGRVAAWVRHYGEPVGTGFVHLYPTTDTGRLDEIRAVTEYGIFRSPVTREIEPR